MKNKKEISLHFRKYSEHPENADFAASPGNTCCSAEEKIFPGQGTFSARRSRKMKNEELRSGDLLSVCKPSTANRRTKLLYRKPLTAVRRPLMVEQSKIAEQDYFNRGQLSAAI